MVYGAGAGGDVALLLLPWGHAVSPAAWRLCRAMLARAGTPARALRWPFGVAAFE